MIDGARRCGVLLADVLALGGYRARAHALVNEARSLGCPTPVGLNSFLR